jgi:hypothetical protein
MRLCIPVSASFSGDECLSLQQSPANEPVYRFMDKKRSEDRPYRVYMMVSANKFLRIYYASMNAYLGSLDES